MKATKSNNPSSLILIKTNQTDSNQILLNSKKTKLAELKNQQTQSNTKLYWGIGPGILGGGIIGI